MASRIAYAVSLTPILAVDRNDDATPDVGNEVHSILAAVGKNLAGNGSITPIDYNPTTVHYAHDENDNLIDAGGPVADTGDAQVTVAGTSGGAIFIRHSGLDTSYAATTALVTVKTATAGTTIAILGAGEAIVLPRCALTPSISCASGTVRVEWAVITHE